MKKERKLPAIGMRIIKSAIGVFLCYLVYLLRGRQGIPFYSMLSVLQCIQPYTGKTMSMVIQRSTGTLVSAVFGLICLLLEIYCFDCYNSIWGFAITALMIIPVIYSTLLLNKKNASYFSCVVFLSITVNHIGDENPYIFVLNRVVDTFIGLGIAILLNSVRIPRKRRKNVLYIAELDDVIHTDREQLTPFSKVEINRMLDEGLLFSVSTIRTPASLIRPLNEINIKLPVIVMDGAALYDYEKKSYLKAYIISSETASELRKMIAEEGMNCFVNALCDEILIIYYGEFRNEAEKRVYEDLHKSPYRNYVKLEPRPDDKIIYLMLIDKTEKILAFYEKLKNQGYTEKLKVLCYPSDDYAGYSYIKIYNKNAGRENMRQYLLSETGAEEIITVGTKDLQTENYICAHKDMNSVVKEIKRSFGG